VAVNRAIDRVKTEKRRKDREARFARERATRSEADWSEIQPHVDEAITELPERFRQVVVAHFLEGRSHAAIARSLGVSRQTVTYRVGKGVERIRDTLKKRGILATSATLAAMLGANTAEAAPPALLAAVGKIAVSGVGRGGGTAMLGATLSLKHAAVGLIAVTLATAVLVFTWHARKPSGLPTANVSVSNAAAVPTLDSPAPPNPATPLSEATSAFATDVRTASSVADIQVLEACSQQPVADIPVVAYRYGREWERRTHSDSSGRINLGALSAGEYRLLLERSAYYLVDGAPHYEEEDTYRKVRFVVGEDGAIPEARLYVARGATVTGRVYDEVREAPLAGIMLDAFTKHPGTNVRHVRGAVGVPGQTNAEGMYRIDGIPPGRFEVVCWCPGRRTYRHSIQVPLDAQMGTNVDFAVDLGVRVTGRVVDISGQPVPNAAVHGVARAQGELKSDETCTGADGAFMLHGFMKGGRFLVQAVRGSDISDITGPFELPANELSDVVVTLRPGPTISGLVVDQEGDPVGEAQLYAYHLPENFPYDRADARGILHGDFGYGVEGTADADGTFDLVGMNPGAYGLIAVGPNDWRPSSSSMPYLMRIDVARNTHLSEVRLVLGQPEPYGLSVSGRVTDGSGNPLSRARVTAQQGHGIGSWTDTSDESGHYTIVGLPGGDYAVSARASGFGGSEEVTVAAGSAGVDFRLEPGASLQANVIDAVTDEPITRFQYLYREPRRMSPGFLGGAGKSWSGGSFSLGGLDSRPRTLIVWAPGYVAACEQLQLNPGEKREMDVRLEPTRPLEGWVVDGRGQPIAAARLYAEAPDFVQRVSHEEVAHGTQYYDALSRDDGSFTIDALLPNTLRLHAYKQGYALGSVEVPEDPDAGRALRIVLTGGGCIEGRVTLGGQPPPPALRSSMVELLCTAPLDSTSRHVSCDGDDAYHFEHATAGEYQLRARLAWGEGADISYRTLTRTVYLRDGEALAVDLDFPIYACSVRGTVSLNGRPPETGRLIIEWTTELGDMEQVTVSCDPQGHYVLDGLPETTLLIRVLAFDADGASAQEEYEIRPQAAAALRQDFEL